jgi:hypothetical protein
MHIPYGNAYMIGYLLRFVVDELDCLTHNVSFIITESQSYLYGCVFTLCLA